MVPGDMVPGDKLTSCGYPFMLTAGQVSVADQMLPAGGKPSAWRGLRLSPKAQAAPGMAAGGQRWGGKQGWVGLTPAAASVEWVDIAT